MRINEIRIQNFKGFKELTETFDPNFTVFVGENGSGKTSVLEAVATALYPFCMAMEQYDVFESELAHIQSRTSGSSTTFEPLFPVLLEAEGIFSGKPLSWTYEYDGKVKPTLRPNYGPLFDRASEEKHRYATSSESNENWPVVALYSANRGREKNSDFDFNHVFVEKPKRTDAYNEWRTSANLVSGFSNWLGRQEAIAFQEGEEPPSAATVKSAITSCLPGAKSVRFSARQGEPIVSWNDGTAVTFGNLSHGQKSILAMVGDIARRCAMVNPHLETDAPAKTPGIVLIDELDLHLHPRWQRRIVDDLKRTFPEIQFITTTHSPFIIQALEPGELRVLGDEEPKIEYTNKGIEEIARFIQGVDMPATSERFTKQKEAAKTYFQMLRQGRDESDPELLDAKSKLDRLTVSYADNPGLEAIIEIQEETANPSILVREE